MIMSINCPVEVEVLSLEVLLTARVVLNEVVLHQVAMDSPHLVDVL